MLLRLFSFICLLLFSGLTMAIEEPKYDVLEASEAFELRAYKPMIVAETFVDGDLDAASSKGFKLIADYIFGNNKSATGASEKISMTVPVTMEPKSEKISTTAPVSMQEAAGKWRVHFVMPSKYTLDTLPVPNNAEVKLRQVESKKFAVIRFSGFAGEGKTAKKTEELLAWLQTKQIKPAGVPELARYNAPWTLPFLRRNEVMVEYLSINKTVKLIKNQPCWV
jgi:SOUL heme-binding protein